MLKGRCFHADTGHERETHAMKEILTRDDKRLTLLLSGTSEEVWRRMEALFKDGWRILPGSGSDNSGEKHNTTKRSVTLYKDC
jgi:hypothetical protein